MKRLFLFLCVGFLSSFSLLAQQQTIIGQVVDETTNDPLPGVNVLAKGTATGTVTDVDGNYRLTLDNEVLTLVFSSIGYETIEENINGRSEIKISLTPDIQSLDEIVVVGYGEQKKVNLTGSVEEIDGNSITRQPVFQASQALAGLAPGLTAIQSSGQPGSDGATLRIRGTGSLGASNDPLVLIDGIAGDLNGIDPNDIENISVLKDAAAAAIYGSRASNGVILVTTRRGTSGGLSVNYNGYVGVQAVTDIPQYLGAVDFLQLAGVDQAVVDDYAANVGSDPDLYPDTDWMDLLFSENGLQQYHSLSVDGGNENVRFLASISYTDQNANVSNYNFKRYNGRFNTDIKLSEKLNLNPTCRFFSNFRFFP